MSFVSWILALSILIVLVIKGTEYHRALVCRQEAWKISLEMTTHSLFPEASQSETNFHLGCRLLFRRENRRVTWQKASSLQKTIFELGLRGSL